MKPIILLGAGFNADVKSEVIIQSVGVDENYKDYPLLNKMAEICNYDEDGDIESQLYSDIKRGNYEPLKNFYKVIMGCDHYLAKELKKDQNNCYYRFFDKFKGHQFLTFNYDSLPEIMLFKLKYWHPKDGYGIPVQCNYDVGLERVGNIPQHSSQSKVLHLHGTFCLYTSDHTIIPDGNQGGLLQQQEPVFIFDPLCISNAFPPFSRKPRGFRIGDRIIVPIPNKAIGLKQNFIQSIYQISHKYIQQSGRLITIGYSFNDYDISSYQPILESLNVCKNPSMIIISPCANDICHRLKEKDFTDNIDMRPINKTFKEWVDSDLII